MNETQPSKTLQLHEFMRNGQNEQKTVNCVKDSKYSVSYESWLLGSAELVEEDTDVPCFMKLSKISFLGNVHLTVRKCHLKWR